MQQANGADCRPQYTASASSRQIVVGSPGECKKNNFEVFSCRHFNSKKTVLQSAPEHTSFLFTKLKTPPPAPTPSAPRPVRGTLDPWPSFTKS